MRGLKLLLIVAGLWAAPAPAEPAPIIAPAPEWVEAVEIPAPDPAQASKPYQPLLLTAQTRYGELPEYYLEFATKVQNAQGLSGLGTVVLPWEPDRGDLIVHKVHILRDGKVIDLLADGQTFTVLRRESSLEMAILNGVLTAMLQAEGLTVGDVLNVAFTVREKKGALPLRGENLFHLPSDLSVRHLRYRQIWPERAPMRWRAAGAMGTPRQIKTRWGRELLLDMRDPKVPKVPENAPARYRLPALLELSQYGDWADISRMLAPAYTSARTIDAQSPLRQEIDRIAAATPDPEKRALMALRLVQDRIRYLALVLGDGGLVPASADQTWKRKFGDCKGKTATLLALLDGLGIEAEPVLVSNGLGSALSEHLPLVRLFDHVLVRARVNGRSLWLDGTRADAGTIDELASVSFGSGLPVRAAGAALEALPQTPPNAPIRELALVWDASAGLDKPARVSGTMTMRGELAGHWKRYQAEQEATDVQDALKPAVLGVPSDDVKIDTMAYDEATNSFSFTFHAETRLAWTQVSPSKAVRIKFNNEVVEWNADFEREDPAHKDVPFELGFPFYSVSRETFILPDGGKGFRLEAVDFDQEVAGARIARKVTLEGGRATAVSTFLQLRSEVSAAEALAAKPILRRINDDVAYVRSADNYAIGAAGPAAVAGPSGSEPTTARGLVERGYFSMQDGRVKDALADFDKALALSPRWALAHANRGIALIHSGKYAEARAALDQAQSLSGDKEDFVVSQGLGLLHLAENRPAEAVEALTRSLALNPENAFTLSSRSDAYSRLGRIPEALADIKRALEIRPPSARQLTHQWRLAVAAGDEAAALAAAEKVIGLDERISGLMLKAEGLQRFGRSAEAAAPYREALAEIDRMIAAASGDEKHRLNRQRVIILLDAGRAREAIEQADSNLRAMPESTIDLNERCWTRVLANVELEAALKDCDRAIGNDPGYAPAIDSRGWARLRLGRLDEAIADFDAALRLEPQLGASLYGRSLAKRRKGDIEASERDLAAARRVSFDIEARFRRYGLGPGD